MTIPVPPQPTQPQLPPPGRRFPARGGLVIGSVVLALLVVGGIATALVMPDRGGPGFGRHGGPGDAALLSEELGFGAELDGPGFDPRDDRGGGRFDGEHRPGRGLGLGRLGDDTLLAGTVVSTTPGTLVVTPDGAAQRTFATSDDTRVFGGGNRSVADLTAGERVGLRIDGTGDAATVVAVWAPRARVAGTVTALTGDQATIIAVNGLTVTADLAGIGQKPAVGDLVAIVGGAEGSTLRADELRVLPKTQ